MGLSKKHFLKIAEILNQEIYEIGLKEDRETQVAKSARNATTLNIMEMLGDYFATENPQFDRQRFKEAVLKGISE